MTLAVPGDTETCLLYGLHVVSQIPLHVRRPAPAGRPIDVTITVGDPRIGEPPVPAGELLAELESPERRLYTFVTRDDGHHLLRFYRAVDFVVSPDLRSVTAHRAAEADPGLAAVLASGALMSFLLMLRGEPLLHASAVDVGGRALAFVGYAGMGKSTMATLMCAAGASIVTDDVLRLDLDQAGGGARTHLGAIETRLRKSASELIAAFTADDGRAPGHRRTGDQRDALRLPAATADLLPLGAIVVPQPRRDIRRVDVTRLRGTDALLTLAGFPRLLGWEHAPSQAAQFQHLADVVERVPVFSARVPWGPPFDPTIAPQLLDAVGLAPAAGLAPATRDRQGRDTPAPAA